MADDKAQNNEDKGQEIPKEVPTKEVQPQGEKQPQTTPQAQLSDEQVASLKDSITKDVSGVVSQEVSKSVIQKIGDALGLTKKQEEALPTDADALKKIVNEQLEQRFAKLEEEGEKEEKQSETQRQERINGIVQGWYTQYNQLSKLGKVPQMKEAKEGDAGYDARKKLILAIGKMIEQNRSQGIEYTPSISDILVAHPQVLEGPPGADLPISGNTQVRETGESFKYKDIKEKSFEEIAAGNI